MLREIMASCWKAAVRPMHEHALLFVGPKHRKKSPLKGRRSMARPPWLRVKGKHPSKIYFGQRKFVTLMSRAVVWLRLQAGIFWSYTRTFVKQSWLGRTRPRRQVNVQSRAVPDALVARDGGRDERSARCRMVGFLFSGIGIRPTNGLRTTLGSADRQGT